MIGPWLEMNLCRLKPTGSERQPDNRQKQGQLWSVLFHFKKFPYSNILYINFGILKFMKSWNQEHAP